MSEKTYTLPEYVNLMGWTPQEFAEKSGINFGTIRSAMEGYEIRYSSCIKIEDFTHGAVPYIKLAPTRTRKQRKSKADSHQVDEDQAVS